MAWFLIAWGLSVMTGWVVQKPVLLLVLPGSAPTTFGSAALFTLSGIWLFLLMAHPYARVQRRSIAGLILGFSILVLIEIASGSDFGVDLISLHRWMQSDTPHLGRLAPNTVICFLTIGLVFTLFDARRGMHRNSLFLTVLRVGLALVVGTSLLGYFLQLEWLYKWFAFNRMALGTAIAMSVLTMSIFVATQPKPELDDALRISVLALGLLGLVTAVAGLTGFAIFKQGMQHSLKANVQAVADSRAEFLLTTFRQGIQVNKGIASSLGLKSLLLHWSNAPGDVERVSHGLRDEAIALDLDFIQVLDNRGISLVQIGKIERTPELELPMHTEGGEARLLWNGGAGLRVITPVVADGRVIGTVVTEHDLPEVEKVFRYTDSMGESGEIKLCGRRLDQLECFPSRLVPQVHRVPFFKNGQPSFPVSRAILGQSGQIDVIDFRGIRVFASFVPVGDTGLGLVAKMDSDEIYRPLQTRGLWLLSLPLVLLTLAGYFLHRRVGPIARRLQDSESAARGYAEDVTESMFKLEAARMQLALSETRSRTIVESAFDAYIAMDTQGMVVNWNEAATRIFGFTREQALGQRLSELVIPERFRAMHEQGLSQYLTTGVGPVLGRRIEMSALRSDGQEIPVEMTITVMVAGEGQWFSCFLHDISARKKALAEIEIRERLLRSVTDALPVLMAYVDQEQRYRYCNETYFEMFGVRPETLLGRTISELLGDEGYALIKPHLDQAFTGDTTTFECPITAKGELRYIEGRLIPRKDAEGAIVGLYVAVWDITQSRQRELHLADKANKDALTGLLNRAAILEVLDEEIQAHYKRRDGIALLFLDADKFKSVNDTLGHAAGDEVLRIFAQRLTETVRGTDFVARLGGDEFVVVLTAVDSAQTAALVAAKIIASINEPMTLCGEARTVSTSIGMAYIENQLITADALLAQADAALYEAKREGRNIYRMRDLTQGLPT